LTCLVNQFSAKNHLLEKALRQVFGLFVPMAFVPQVTIDGFPILAQEIVDEHLVICLAVGRNSLNDAPLRCLKRFPGSADACVIMAFHGVLILCLYPAVFKQ